MNADEGRLVESGSFRVDARRALEILRERQLPDSFWRPGLWVRCAAACGATRMSFERGGRSLVVFFDGEPVPAGTLAEPFERLLGEEGSAAERWFALALLHTLRPGVRVLAASGSAAFAYADDGASDAQVSSGPGTLVTADWTRSFSASRAHPAWWRLLEAQGEHYYRLIEFAAGAPFPIRFKDGGVELEQQPWPGSELVSPGGAEPALKLYLLGTLVHAGRLVDFPFPLTASLRDDALSVDASLRAVVRDAAFFATEERARRLAGAFALRVIARHAKAFRLAAALLAAHRRLRLDWVDAMGLFRGDEPFVERLKLAFSDKRRSGDRQRVLRAAESTRLLRLWALCGLRSRRVDARDLLRDALWRAPLFVSTRGAPLSLDDLGADSGKPPEVWRRLDPPGGGSEEKVWALSPLDTVFLRNRFPNRPGR